MCRYQDIIICMKKKIRGIIVILVVAGIFYLTFQSPSQTTALSEGFRKWLMDHGVTINSPYYRSWAHLPMYFVLGFSLCLWDGWKTALVIGPVVATIDETIKIFLPTRHFDPFDLILDYIGIALGTLTVVLIRKLVRSIH